MRNGVTRAVLALTIAFLAPTALVGQQPAPGAIPPEAEEIIVEIEQIQSELGPIQQEALQDPALQTEQQALGQEIQAAMTELDPATPEHMQRLQTLIGDAQAAQAAQDQQRMMQIVGEAQQIEQRLQTIQSTALEQPEIASRVEAFQQQLERRMVELDPQAEGLIERFEELDSRLASLMGVDG